jgi:arylsulfatase
VTPLLSRRSARAWLSALALVGSPAIAPGADAPGSPKKPNVIVVLTDDNGYGDLSCHGNPVLKTPHFDAVHAQAVRLTDFHVCPMCTPTRGQLLTGMDALHNGASSVSAGRSMVRRGIPTLADAFRAAGYRTALYGKWHLGDSHPHLPHARGFQDAVYHLGWGITSMADTWENDLFDGRFFHNGTLKPYPGYCTDVFFDLTMKWIEDRQARNEPFFVYLPTNVPHTPHWVAEKYKQLYAGKGPAPFFGMMANLDENLGRLDAFLRQRGLLDDTVLIYMNDNGATAGAAVYNAGLRGRKTTYYEGGHRSACFVRWPAGNLRKPCDLDALTEVQDIFPTLLDLCGVPKPANARFDGISLAGYLKGTDESIPDRTLVVQYGEQPNGRALLKWDSAVMRGKWRLVHGKELFDLRSDPGQEKDVASQHPEIVRSLRDHYEKWWAGIEPTLEDFEPISVGSDAANPVTLTSADWAKVYCDNMNNLRTGKSANGPWHLLVEKPGTYEIELRRWPKAADAPIAGPVPAFKAKDGGLPAGVPLPIAKVRLKVGPLDETRPVGPQDKGITFTVPLSAGKQPMQTWCYDAAGKELCGAYFAYVRRQ